MTITATRRALLSSLAAIPAALATPALAGALGGPDPILALIAAADAAGEASDAAMAAHADLANALPADVVNDVTVPIAGRWATSHDEIEAFAADEIERRRWFYDTDPLYRARKHQLIRTAHEKLDALTRWQAADRERSGLAGARETYDLAQEAEDEAIAAVLAAPPTTAAGAQALVAFLLRQRERWLQDEYEERIDVALERLAEGLGSIADAA